MKIKFEIPRQKRRATELYDADSPFRQKVVPAKKAYSRKRKHRDKEDDV